MLMTAWGIWPLGAAGLWFSPAAAVLGLALLVSVVILIFMADRGENGRPGHGTPTRI